MKAKAAVEYLKNNLVFFTKLGFYHAPVILEENGMPFVFYTEEDAEKYCKTIDNFCDTYLLSCFVLSNSNTYFGGVSLKKINFLMDIFALARLLFPIFVVLLLFQPN